MFDRQSAVQMYIYILQTYTSKYHLMNLKAAALIAGSIVEMDGAAAAFRCWRKQRTAQDRTRTVRLTVQNMLGVDGGLEEGEIRDWFISCLLCYICRVKPVQSLRRYCNNGIECTYSIQKGMLSYVYSILQWLHINIYTQVTYLVVMEATKLN